MFHDMGEKKDNISSLKCDFSIFLIIRLTGTYYKTPDYVTRVARNSHIQMGQPLFCGVFSLGRWQLSLNIGWHILLLDLEKHWSILENL